METPSETENTYKANIELCFNLMVVLDKRLRSGQNNMKPTQSLMRCHDNFMILVATNKVKKKILAKSKDLNFNDEIVAVSYPQAMEIETLNKNKIWFT